MGKARGERGPQSPEPWGSAGGVDREAPWGVSEDSPMDEGSEETAVTGDRLGERRAAELPPDGGRRRLGVAPEPTRAPEAGPGGPPDPAPPMRPFPDESDPADLGDNPLEDATGMRSEGVTRDE